MNSFPLNWPAHRTRTAPGRRRDAAFRTAHSAPGLDGVSTVERVTRKTLAQAERELSDELRLLGAREIIVSSNMVLNRDGTIRSSQAEPDDPGVAVFFGYRGVKMAFACDRWTRAADNLYAIAKTIRAIRGIERWGSGEMVRAAFTGFRALPMPARPWRMVLGFSEDERPSIAEVDRRHRDQARRLHPDIAGEVQGTEILMAEINAARDEARRELSG